MADYMDPNDAFNYFVSESSPDSPPAPEPAPTSQVTASTDPLAHAYDNPIYDVTNRAGWVPSASDLGTLAFDPSIYSGTQQSLYSTTGGGGLQGTQFGSTVDPSLAASVKADPNYDVQKNLSELLQSNQFDKAVSYAQENNALDYLTTPSVLSNLRTPFTKDEAASFLQSMSAVDPGTSTKYDPNAALASSMSQWNSDTGYAGYGGGLYRPKSAFDNIMDNLVNAAIIGSTTAAGYGAGTALSGALGAAGAGAGTAAGAGTGAAAGSTLGAIESAAIKSAVGSAFSTALRGGDIGDILKSAAIGAGTGGISSAAAPALYEGLKEIPGVTSNVAKALTNSIVSGGVSAIRGGDPLQSAVTSGLGSYIGSTIGDYARANEWDKNDVALAGRLGSIGGSGLASAIVGGDPKSAMIQSAINQFSSPALDSAKEQVKGMFPGLYDKVSSIFGNNITDWTAFANSADAQAATDALSNRLAGMPGGLDYVNVTPNRTMLDQNGNIVSATGTPAYYDQNGLLQWGYPGEGQTGYDVPPEDTSSYYYDQNGLLQFGTPAPGEGSASGEGLDEVTINSNRIPIDNVIDTGGDTGGLPSGAAETTTGGSAAGDNSELEQVLINGNLYEYDAAGNIVVTYPDGSQEVKVVTKKDPLDEVVVTAKKDPADNKITDWGDTGESVVVTGDKTTGTGGTTTTTDKPSDIKDPTVKVVTGGGGALPAIKAAAAAGVIPKDEFLDSAAEFLKSQKGSEGARLAALKQLYEGLDPSLASLLSERLSKTGDSRANSSNLSPLSWSASNQAAPGAAFTGFGGFARGGVARFSDGGSADENPALQGPTSVKSIFKDLATIDSQNGKFVCAEPEYLKPGKPRDKMDVLKKLVQMQAFGSGGGLNMARGGLAEQYKAAAPEGHNPEFITGLTGYYAQGGGTGQSDDIPSMLHDGDYVMDADVVAALGDGSSKAGAEVLERMRNQVPYREGNPGKPVPAKIADGEFVFPAAFVTALGGGDNKRGSKILDGMREKIRAHKRSAPTSKIPPKAKSPLDYLKGVKG